MEFDIHWPQIVMICLYVIGLTNEGIRDGEPKTGKHNFWILLLATFISFGITYFGGFWS